MALDDYQVVTQTERAVGQGILQESQSKNSPLGTRLALNDGRIFRYALNSSAGTALLPAQLVQSPANLSTEINLNDDARIPAKGDTSITLITGSSIAADLFADGYIYTDDDTGEGQFYKIKSHPAADSASCVFTLYDSVRTACAAATTYGLQKNPYNLTIIQVASGSTQTGRTVGVPLIPVTASYFYWLQTWGDGLGWVTTTEAVGIGLMNGTTAGKLAAADATLPTLGSMSAHIGIAAEYKAVHWTISA